MDVLCVQPETVWQDKAASLARLREMLDRAEVPARGIGRVAGEPDAKRPRALQSARGLWDVTQIGNEKAGLNSFKIL